MKLLVSCLLFLATVLAEPPVPNSYLPPQSEYRTLDAEGLGLAQLYAPGGYDSPRHTGAIARRPVPNYEKAPRHHGNTKRPNEDDEQPIRIPIPRRYGVPKTRQPNKKYGPPRPAAREFNAPARDYRPPSQLYGPPVDQKYSSQQEIRSNVMQGRGYAPGAPAGPAGPDSRRYLPPNRRSGYSGGEGNQEPANYNFEYSVKDEESGNDFGHRESRMGDRAQGAYYVQLPDGRKQMVEYEADQRGYRPKITYEDTGRRPGYNNRYAQKPYQGYDNGGPY